MTKPGKEVQVWQKDELTLELKVVTAIFISEPIIGKYLVSDYLGKVFLLDAFKGNKND